MKRADEIPCPAQHDQRHVWLPSVTTTDGRKVWKCVCCATVYEQPVERDQQACAHIWKVTAGDGELTCQVCGLVHRYDMAAINQWALESGLRARFQADRRAEAEQRWRDRLQNDGESHAFWQMRSWDHQALSRRHVEQIRKIDEELRARREEQREHASLLRRLRLQVGQRDRSLEDYADFYELAPGAGYQEINELMRMYEPQETPVMGLASHRKGRAA